MKGKFVPTVGNRKLGRLTLVTEKNIGKVMGDLNRFFSKPTMKFNGWYPKKVGEEVHTYGSDVWVQDVMSEEMYPDYRTFIGYCDYHHLWKDHLAGKSLFTCDISETPRLAISSHFELSCCPISIGSRYKIFGNKLVILDKYNKIIHTNPYCKPSWLRYTEYIQVSSIPDDEIFDYKSNSLSIAVTDETCYASEELEYRVNGKYHRDELYDAIRDLSDGVSDAVKRLCKYASNDFVTEEIKAGEKTITFAVKTAEWFQKGLSSDSYKFLVNGEETTSIIQAVCLAYKDEIAEWNKVKPDDDFDYDDF